MQSLKYENVLLEFTTGIYYLLRSIYYFFTTFDVKDMQRYAKICQRNKKTKKLKIL